MLVDPAVCLCRNLMPHMDADGVRIILQALHNIPIIFAGAPLRHPSPPSTNHALRAPSQSKLATTLPSLPKLVRCVCYIIALGFLGPEYAGCQQAFWT